MYMFKLHFFLKKGFQFEIQTMTKIYKHGIKFCLIIKTRAFLELT